MISREARGYVELLGKALDRIRDTPPIQINLLVNPEWLDLKRQIVTILAAEHPAALEALRNALQ